MLAHSFTHSHGRGGNFVQDDALLAIITPEGQHAGGTLLDAGGAAHAFGVLHRQTLVREVHDVDPLMANRGADVAGNAFRFFGKNPETRETRIDVHEGGQRTKEPAPDAPGIFEIKADADDAAEENIHEPFVVRVGNQLTVAVFALEQQMEGGCKYRLRPNPAEDPDEQKEERDSEDHLARHVQPIPERTMRHFVALLVAHRFGERAAGANPAAVSALAPAPDDEPG